MRFEVDIAPTRGNRWYATVWVVDDRAFELCDKETRTVWGAKRWAKKASKRYAHYRTTEHVEYTLNIE